MIPSLPQAFNRRSEPLCSTAVLSYALATSCAARDGGLLSRETDKADSHRKGWTVTVDWGS